MTAKLLLRSLEGIGRREGLSRGAKVGSTRFVLIDRGEFERGKAPFNIP